MTRHHRCRTLTIGLLALVFGNGLALNTSAADQQQLNWGLTAWPGLVNSANGEPTDGMVIDLLSEITRRMPEYQHHLQLMNTSRSLVDLQQRNDVCIVDVQRNAERDQIGYFVGLFLNLPPQLVIRSSDLQRISQGHKSISLKQLLQRSDLRGGLPAGRIYGPELTALLEAAEASGQIQRIQSSGRGSNLLGMLEHGRIDYTLEYAETIQLMQGSPDMRPIIQSLHLLPLQETTQPIISGIYCPRTAQGKLLVKQIDKIAGDPQVLKHFAAAMEYFAPPSTRQHYSKMYDDYLNNRATGAYTNLQE